MNYRFRFRIKVNLLLDFDRKIILGKRYFIVMCVFVVAETFLSSRCIAMEVFAGFLWLHTFSFRHHTTIGLL
jgi:hypothetical protein